MQTSLFFVHYHSNTHESVCEAIPEFSYKDTLIKNLECYDGWTDVGIFIYFDNEFSLEECEECRPPDSNEEGVIAYYFELSCTPICESIEPSTELFESLPCSAGVVCDGARQLDDSVFTAL